MAARIDGREISHLFEGVGTVATSASGDLYFLEDVLAAFEDGDIHLRTQLLEVDGKEETCGSSADDGCMQFTGEKESLKTAESQGTPISVRMRTLVFESEAAGLADEWSNIFLQETREEQTGTRL